MAGAWVSTSCSSWQRMQVSTSFSAGVEPRWGPTATHSSLCSMAQLEQQNTTQTRIDFTWSQGKNTPVVFLDQLGSPISYISRHNRFPLCSAFWHIVIQHLVWLNEVLLHRWHLGHNLLPMKLGGLCLPFSLSFLFVLSTLESKIKTELE